MATIATASINLDKIDKSKIYEGKNGKYLTITVTINDETRYGNNLSVSEAQTKEERDAKTPKNYLGNGKVVWTDGSIVVAEKEVQENFEEQPSDLPF